MSSTSPTISTETEFRLPSCSCCAHSDCVPLKERRLCSQWFFLRWDALPFTTSLDMVRELQSVLGSRQFLIQPVKWEAGVYEALVKVEPSEDTPSVLPPSLLPLVQSAFFYAARSSHRSLSCCWTEVKSDLPVWLSFIRSCDDGVTIGETNLGKLLLSEIRHAATGRTSLCAIEHDI
jgi:hypothetical protein